MIGPLEDLVKRILRRVDVFAAEHGVERVTVSAELFDGALHRLASIWPSPAS